MLLTVEDCSHYMIGTKNCIVGWPHSPSLLFSSPLDQTHSTKAKYINPKQNRWMLGQSRKMSEVLWCLKLLLLSSAVGIVMREGLDSMTAGCGFALFFVFFSLTSCLRFGLWVESCTREQLGPVFCVLVQLIPSIPLTKKRACNDFR